MKVFCIGRNKTGTTSLSSALKGLGYIMGSQRSGELLIRDWINNDFTNILNLVNTADAFQDIPFSYDNTYEELDKHFPNSKFILSIRDSPEEWYDSLVRFHSKMFGKGKIPTAQQLKNSNHVWKGWIYEAMYNLYKTTENDPYNKEILINHYENYNNKVISYFKDRPDDLLVINLKNKNSYLDFCEFLGKEPKLNNFPHLNKSKKTISNTK